MRTTHPYVYEILYHFNCGECKNWWSYAKTPARERYSLDEDMTGKYMHCPHCGQEAEVAIKEDF